MKTICIILAMAALVSGLWAAWKWYAASKIHPKPNWEFEPVVPTLKHMGWTSATLQAFGDAGRLNASAAMWTAISVALGAASNILGSLS